MTLQNGGHKNNHVNKGDYCKKSMLVEIEDYLYMLKWYFILY